MGFVLELSEHAKKDIQSLDKVTQKRIATKLKYFLDQDDPLVFAKALTSAKDGDHRWRVGHYRVVFDLKPNKTILVLRVQHRSKVYKQPQFDIINPSKIPICIRSTSS